MNIIPEHLLADPQVGHVVAAAYVHGAEGMKAMSKDRRSTDAIRAFEEGLKKLDPLLKDPAHAESLAYMASFYHQGIASSLAAQEKFVEAVSPATIAVGLREKASSRQPANLDIAKNTLTSHTTLSHIHSKLGNKSQEVISRRNAIEASARVAALENGSVDACTDHYMRHHHLADVLVQADDIASASEALQSALTIAEKQMLEKGGETRWAFHLAMSAAKLSWTKTRLGETAAATALLERSRQILKDQVARGGAGLPGDPTGKAAGQVLEICSSQYSINGKKG